MTMAYLSLFLMLPLVPPADGGTRAAHSHQTTRAMTRVTGAETATLPPPYLHLPVFVDSRVPLVDKKHFSPSRGTGREPLPEGVREVLLPPRTDASSPPASALPVKASCRLKTMLVRVDRGVLDGDPRPRLKLGTCQPSKHTADYIYFEYDLVMCGSKRTIINNQVVYSNTLQYDPPKHQGPIRRAVPFTLPVACYYNRYLYSYKIGYTPKMRMYKIFKPMKSKVKFILTPRNAQWERLSPSDKYMLGQPMFFEAETLSMSQDERLYIHLCYATPEKSHTSTPQFPVVKNFGCMVESKENRSMFIPYKNNAVRFFVDAFLFKGMSGQELYMHCSMSVSSSTPTPTTKSCNYDIKARRWVELYGPDSVCTCCDSNCSSAGSKVTKIISSRPLTIKPKEKLNKVPRRKMISTMTTKKTQAAQTQPTRERIKLRTTLQPVETAVTAAGKLTGMVAEMEQPFGGRGVSRIRVGGEEKQVKGSAVVEVEDIKVPHLIFEDIFDFDK